MYTEINSENAEAAGASGTAATTQEEEVVEGQEDGDVTLVEQGAYHYIQTFSVPIHLGRLLSLESIHSCLSLSSVEAVTACSHTARFI